MTEGDREDSEEERGWENEKMRERGKVEREKG